MVSSPIGRRRARRAIGWSSSKRVEVGKGQLQLFEEYRYFFYITNDRKMAAEEVVFSANDPEGAIRRT